jgi:tripartite-type tricarboxylate transporter receptor subunit TctC
MKQPQAIFLAASLAMGWGLVAGPSSAQTAAGFPSQPVRIISAFPAGSGPDVVARIVGEKLATSFKQSVIIDPRPGANGFLALGAVKQAAPTVYDLLLAPKATPAAVVDVLNRSLNDALKQPDVADKFANFGFVPDPITPAALAALIDSDTLVYAEVVKRTGASAD